MIEYYSCVPNVNSKLEALWENANSHDKHVIYSVLSYTDDLCIFV